MINVGLDVGHARIKTISDKGQTNYVAMLALYNPELRVGYENQSEFIVGVNGKEWLVGDSAERLAPHKAYHISERQYPFTEEWYTLFLASLTEAGVPSSKIFLTTGLPVEYYKIDGPKLVEKLTSIGNHRVWRRGITYEYQLAGIKVTSQFYGAAIGALVSGHPIAPLLKDKRPIAICDLGGGTGNFGLLDRMEPVEGTTFHEDIGSWTMIPAIKKVIANHFGTQPLRDYQAMNVLRDNAFYFNGQEWDVTDLIAPIKDQTAQEIVTMMRSRWSSELTKLAGGLFWVGGTSLLLKPWLEKYSPHVNVFFGNEMGNAQGYYAISQRFSEM